MITESYLEDIADAIREKKGGSNTYTPGEMAAAISSIDGGSTPVINSLNVTPSESQQVFNASNIDGYKPVTVAGIPLDYVGSGIERQTASTIEDSLMYLLEDECVIVIPSGYYENQVVIGLNNVRPPKPTISVSNSGLITASYNINSGYLNTNNASLTYSETQQLPTITLPTSAASSATSGYTSKATIGRSTSNQYINIPPGYNSAGAYYVINAVANGSASAPSTISGTSATVSTGTNTLTLTKTVSVTPTVSAGYISSGTATNSSVSLTASVTTKAAATITPGTTNQTIASGTYLTGTQTIAGDSDLVGSNILSTANIFGVQGQVVVQNYYTGSSAPSSSLGSNGDLYLQS